jgi:hypothetical protein
MDVSVPIGSLRDIKPHDRMREEEIEEIDIQCREGMPDNGTLATECEMEDARDVYDIYTDSTMFKAMRPLFVSLMMFGMYHCKRYGSLTECKQRYLEPTLNDEAQNTQKTKASSRRNGISCSTAYSWVVCFSFFVYYVRLFSMIDPDDTFLDYELAFKLTTLTYHTILMVTCIMHVRMAHRFDCLPWFFIQLDAILHDLPEKAHYVHQLQKMTKTVVVLSWVFLVMNTGVLILAVVRLPDILQPLFAPLQEGDPYVTLVKVIVAVFYPYCAALMYFGLALDVIISCVLWKLFDLWASKFRGQCAKGMTTARLVREQRHHQRICHLVRTADSCMAMSKAGTFIGYITIVLLILYNLLYMPAQFRTPSVYVVNTTWVLFSATNLIVMCTCAVLINGAVSDSYIPHQRGSK